MSSREKRTHAIHTNISLFLIANNDADDDNDGDGWLFFLWRASHKKTRWLHNIARTF